MDTYNHEGRNPKLLGLQEEILCYNFWLTAVKVVDDNVQINPTTSIPMAHHIQNPRKQSRECSYLWPL